MDEPQDHLFKAAVLLHSLDAETAAGLLERIPAEAAERVRARLKELDSVADDERHRVIGEFLALSGAQRPRLSPQTHPAGGDVLPPPAGRRHAPFRILAETSSEELLPLLEGERPQTIAVVVAHLPSRRAAEVLAQLPPAVQVQVIHKLVHLHDADPDVLREVEASLAARIALGPRASGGTSGLATVATILHSASEPEEQQIRANLTRHAPALAGKLAPRDALSFSDLQTLDDDLLARLISTADPDVLVLALTESSATLVDRMLGQLPPREAKLLRRALDNLGPTRLSDVEAAKNALLKLAHKLHADRGPQGHIAVTA